MAPQERSTTVVRSWGAMSEFILPIRERIFKVT